MRLWLDDLRPAPDGWVHAHSVNEAIRLLQSSTVDEVSLDHDLGEYASDGGDGWKLTNWMAEHEVWPAKSVGVHSANPVGARRMLSTVDQYGPYRPGSPWDRARRM